MLVDELTVAGAVMVPRGSRNVCAHFGSVGAEESVCRKHVGMALRSDLDVGELDGGAEPGRAVRSGDVWLAGVGLGRTLAIGLPAAVACRGARPCPDVAISLVGPRTEPLLAAAGLPLPVELRVCWWAGGFTVLLRERAERVLLLVPPECGVTAWHALLDAGRPLALACVGVDALARLAAAQA